MGAQFSRFVIFGRFFVFLGDPSKIAVLPAWELNSVCIPPPQPLRKCIRVGFRARWAPRPPHTAPRHLQTMILAPFWRYFGSILQGFFV